MHTLHGVTNNSGIISTQIVGHMHTFDYQHTSIVLDFTTDFAPEEAVPVVASGLRQLTVVPTDNSDGGVPVGEVSPMHVPLRNRAFADSFWASPALRRDLPDDAKTIRATGQRRAVEVAVSIKDDAA
jgi:hypothetical protein